MFPVPERTKLNAIRQMVEQKLLAEGITIGEVAIKVGLSRATYYRFLKGDNLDMDTVIRLCKWLEVSPATILNIEAPDNEVATLSTIAAIVNLDPRIAALFVGLANDFREGKVNINVAQDILAYSAFKLKLDHS
jgi:DNA-binding Xre family transcriptional regulator